MKEEERGKKETPLILACNAGSPGSIPGTGRSTGERIGYPFQYSWTFLVTQMVKNPPSMWETWVGKSPRRGMATHSSILTWRIPMDKRSLEGYCPWGRRESDTT